MAGVEWAMWPRIWLDLYMNAQISSFLICQYLFCFRNSFLPVYWENGAIGEEWLYSPPHPIPTNITTSFILTTFLSSWKKYISFCSRLFAASVLLVPDHCLFWELSLVQGANSSFPHLQTLSTKIILFSCKHSQSLSTFKKKSFFLDLAISASLSFPSLSNSKVLSYTSGFISSLLILNPLPFG